MFGSLLLQSGAFPVQGISFSGSSQWMRRGADLTGNADGKKGTVSVWVRLDGNNAANMAVLCNSGQFFQLRRNSSNKFQIQGSDSGGGGGLDFVSNNSYTSGATWRHVLASFDLASATGQMYITDASDIAGGPTLSNVAIDFTRGDWSVGDNAAGSAALTASVAELFFHEDYLDISQSSNRRKFISPTGKPVDLGSNGASPFGVQPLVYFSSRVGDLASAFNVNRGSGGNFTITGSPTIASSSPSD